MKLSQAKEYLPFVQAAAEGKTIQYRTKGGGWINCIDHFVNCIDHFDWFDSQQNFQFRIKPTSTLRPWKPEEVPVGAIIKSEHGQGPFIIMGYHDEGSVQISEINQVMGGWQIFATRNCVYSIDHGKTWFPCGILEE